MSTDLSALFYPASVAIVGASNNPSKASHHIVRTMLALGFTGKLYPVNPAERSVLGLTCYPSVREIPGRLDLLVLSVPAQAALPVIQDAAGRGDVRGAVILSAGFSETGVPELAALEHDIVLESRQAGIRVVGPNCVGLINTANGLCTGFAPGLTGKGGSIGFVTQSGAFAGSVLVLAGAQPDPLGFAKVGHVGNMSDVSNLEVLDYFGDDPTINTIGVYMEGVHDGRGLIAVAREITRRKPVFLMKVGRTDLGMKATFSHTGTLAGSDHVYDAAFRQSGIVRVQNMEELVDACKASSMLPRPAGRCLCVVTNAGGPGIIAMDELGKDSYLSLAPLADGTRVALERVLPAAAMVCKPNGYVDMTASATPAQHEDALRLVLADPNVDSVFLFTLPPTFIPGKEVASAIAAGAHTSGKPVAACLMRGTPTDEARAHLERRGIPTFDTPDRGVRAVVNLTRAAERIAGRC